MKRGRASRRKLIALLGNVKYESNVKLCKVYSQYEFALPLQAWESINVNVGIWLRHTVDQNRELFYVNRF